MIRTKILFTIPNFNTAGSGKALLKIALGLNKNKFESHIACKTNEGVFFEEVKNSGIPVHVFEYQPKARPISRLLKESWKISRKLKEINPDIIHSFHYNNNYTEALAAKLAGIPWVYTKKNMNWGGSGANSWKIRSRLARKIVVQNTDMKQRFFPNVDKTTFISRGIDCKYFAPTPVQPEIREKMNTPQNARIVIAVANIFPVKGIEYLIDAFAQLQPQFTNWHLWIVGDHETKHGRELTEKVKNKNWHSFIRFSGKQKDVRPFLNHAEIFVLPTKAVGEGSPVALLEAMANSKAVLGANVPGIKDQLAQYPENVFEAENIDSLKEKLEALMNSSVEENQRLGREFQKHAEENYSLEKEIKLHELLYESIIDLSK